MKRSGLAAVGAALGGLAAAVLLATLAGASGNGIANASPRQILAKATSAVVGAQSFKVTGIVHDKGQTTALAVTASKNGNGFGTVSLNGQTVQIVKVGGSLYFRAGAAFWRKQSGAQAASLFADRWVQGSASSSDFSQLASFFTTGQLADEFLGKTNTSSTTLSKAGTTSINGQRVLVLYGHDTNDGTSGRIFIATTGQPFVVRISLLKGSGAIGSVTFTGFNAPVNPPVPQGAINVSGATGGSTTASS